MNIDLKKTTFKNFKVPARYDAFEHAAYLNEFLDYLIAEDRLNAGLRAAQLLALKLRSSMPRIAHSEN